MIISPDYNHQGLLLFQKWFLSIPLRATACVKDQYRAGAVVLLNAFSPGRLVRMCEWTQGFPAALE